MMYFLPVLRRSRSSCWIDAVKFQELAVVVGKRVGGRVGQRGGNGARERRNRVLDLFVVRQFTFLPGNPFAVNGFAGQKGR